MPLGGAISGGILLGFGVGMLSFLIMHGIKASHRLATESGKEGDSASNEQGILESLRISGQTDDADLLEKMLGDRDAILKRCRNRSENADAAHTLDLANAIVSESSLQAEELQDLVRRVEDPLLDSPDGAEDKIEEIRAGLRRAYQAVADAQSRLRRGEQLKEVDFLADADSLASRDLSALTGQLEEETFVSRRVEERLRPGFKNRIVMDDPVETVGEDQRELE